MIRWPNRIVISIDWEKSILMRIEKKVFNALVGDVVIAVVVIFTDHML